MPGLMPGEMPGGIFSITILPMIWKAKGKGEYSTYASTGSGYQEGVYKDDGNINTGYIHNWRSLSNTYKKTFISERKS